MTHAPYWPGKTDHSLLDRLRIVCRLCSLYYEESSIDRRIDIDRCLVASVLLLEYDEELVLRLDDTELFLVGEFCVRMLDSESVMMMLMGAPRVVSDVEYPLLSRISVLLECIVRIMVLSEIESH